MKNEFNIYGEIQAWMGPELKSFLSEQDGDVQLNIFSGGGSFIAGVAMMGALDAYNKGAKVCVVEGFAASMATAIMMKCDKIKAFEGSYIMIHNPYTEVSGDSAEMRKFADRLEQMQSDMADVYAKRTGKDKEDILRMMNEETYMSATEALEMGFIDEIMTGKVAEFAAKDLTFMPKALVKAITNTQPKTEELMKINEIFDVLGLAKDSTDEQALEKVKALTSQIGSLTDKIQAKDELISGLKSQVAEFSAKAEEIEKFEIEKLKASLTADGTMIPEARMEKFNNWAKAYIETNDESRLEDLKAYVEIYGVKNQPLDTGSRPQGQTETDKQFQVIARTNEILKERNWSASTHYADAYALAQSELSTNQKGE